MLTSSQAWKFYMYELLKKEVPHEDEKVKILSAATISAFALTTLTYPLDLCHTRMSSDMSKKPSMYNMNAQTGASTKLYAGVIDCMRKSQKSTRDLRFLFSGYRAAIISQVPYSVILMSSFEYFDNVVFSQNQEITFDKYDEYPFIIKFLQRFGASTLSLLIAQSVLYPFDTVKRCLQLNGSLGHKTLYTGSITNCFSTLYKDHGLKGLYGGFSVNLIRCLPLSMVHYMVFQSLKGISQPRKVE